MNKNEILKTWKKVNFAEFGVVKSIDYEGLTEKGKQRVMEERGIETEYQAAIIRDMYFILGWDIEEEDVEDWSNCYEEWHEMSAYNEMSYFVDETFREKYSHFLVHKVRGDWMGNSSYQFYSLEEVLDGEFIGEDCSLFLENVGGRKKWVEFRSCHHDVPFGHPLYLIGLTDQQYRQLKNSHENYQRMNIKKFAESYID